MIAIVTILVVVLLPAVPVAREAVRCIYCLNDLTKIDVTLDKSTWPAEFSDEGSYEVTGKFHSIRIGVAAWALFAGLDLDDACSSVPGGAVDRRRVGHEFGTLPFRTTGLDFSRVTKALSLCQRNGYQARSRMLPWVCWSRCFFELAFRVCTLHYGGGSFTKWTDDLAW